MAKIKLYAASVYHAHGFGCIGVARTEEGAQSYIDGWVEDFPDSADDDLFDISQIEFDPDDEETGDEAEPGP